MCMFKSKIKIKKLNFCLFWTFDLICLLTQPLFKNKKYFFFQWQRFRNFKRILTFYIEPNI